MAYFVRVLNGSGDFELIDSDLLMLYPNVKVDELIPLTDMQYQELCAHDNGTTQFIDGKFQFKAIKTDSKTQFKQLRDYLLNQTANKCDQLKSQVLVGYPQAEIDSFYRQEREAREWLADNSKPTPMLSAIAENRGVPFEILVEKVIEKADLVASIMGHIIGTRQAFEDRILSAKTQAELTALEQEISQWQLNLN